MKCAIVFFVIAAAFVYVSAMPADGDPSAPAVPAPAVPAPNAAAPAAPAPAAPAAAAAPAAPAPAAPAAGPSSEGSPSPFPTPVNPITAIQKVFEQGLNNIYNGLTSVFGR